MLPTIAEELQECPPPPKIEVHDEWAIKIQADALPFILDALGPTFDNLNRDFAFVLKQLRFQQLQHPTGGTEDSPGMCCLYPRDGDVWTRWFYPLRVWARQFCFLPGDYCSWKVNMSTHQEDLTSVGVLTRFILSDLHSGAFDCTTREWRGELGNDYISGLDLSKHKLCLCIMLSVPRNKMDWDDVSRYELRSIFDLFTPRSLSDRVLAMVVRKCVEVGCSHALITDGDNTLYLAFRATKYMKHRVYCQLISSKSFSVVYMVAAVLQSQSESLANCPTRFYGARLQEAVQARNDNATRFRDFDLYSMEHERDLYEAFLDWKTSEELAAFQNMARPMSKFAVRPHVLGGPLTSSCMLAWRNPYPKVALSDEVLQAAFTPYRAVQDDVASMLSSSEPLEFEVMEVKQSGCERFSQVFFGVLRRKSGEQSSGPLCLKLFDERFFPVPSLEKYDYSDGWYPRLAGLNFADQILRREEAAYSRLSEHQGGLLPHFYGCHEFSREENGNANNGEPRIQKTYGILLEVITGQSLSDIRASIVLDWSYAEKKRLIDRFRSIIRVMNHSGITQASPSPGIPDQRDKDAFS